MPELERLQINIDADASGAKRGAAEAKEAMQGLGTTTKQAVGTVERSMSGVTRGVNRLRSMLGLADKSAQGMGKNITAQMSQLERVHEAQSAKAEALRASLQRLKAELAAAQRKAGSTGSAKYAKLAGTLNEKYTSKELQYQNLVTQIDKTAQKIWDLEDAASKAGEQMEKMGRKATRGSGRSKTVFGSIGRSLRSMLIITAVSRGVVNFIGWLGRVVAADSQVSASLAAVRQNLLTAFAPIYNAVLPAIQTLVGWLVTATQAISNFINALFGMTGKQATSIANKIGGIGGAAGGSAKQVNELLASFDELNKLGSGGGSGGGGGGGGSGGGGGGGIGGLGGDAVDSSIETINKGGLQAANVLGTLGKAAAGYGTALWGVSKALKFVKALGGTGWSVASSLKAGATITALTATANSMYEVANSDWYKGRYQEYEQYMAGDYSMGRKAAEWMRYAADGAIASVLGTVSGLWGKTGSETMAGMYPDMSTTSRMIDWFRGIVTGGAEGREKFPNAAFGFWRKREKDLEDLQRAQDEANERLAFTSPRFVGEVITQDYEQAADTIKHAHANLVARINGVLWGQKNAPAAGNFLPLEKYGQQTRDGADKAGEQIDASGQSLRERFVAWYNGINDYVYREISPRVEKSLDNVYGKLVGWQADIEAWFAGPATRTVQSWLGDTLAVDEGEINGKINRLQDIARAVRQGIDNAEAIINKSMENKNIAKETGEMPLGTNSASVAEWATGTAGTGDKADRQNTAADLANAVANILQGTSINVDGKKLGELTVKAINKNARTAGRVDYVY